MKVAPKRNTMLVIVEFACESRCTREHKAQSKEHEVPAHRTNNRFVFVLVLNCLPVIRLVARILLQLELVNGFFQKTEPKNKKKQKQEAQVANAAVPCVVFSGGICIAGHSMLFCQLPKQLFRLHLMSMQHRPALWLDGWRMHLCPRLCCTGKRFRVEGRRRRRFRSVYGLQQQHL